MGFVAVLLLLALIPGGSVFALTPYDDFSGALINPAKWDDQEWVREIRNIGGNNKLVSRVTGYGITNRNYLYVKKPAGIYYMEALVTLTSATATFGAAQTTYSHAGLAGIFYNNGAGSPGNVKGDVMAQVRLELSRGTLKARWWIIKYNQPDGSDWDQVGNGIISGTFLLNQPYKLSVKFDKNTKKFTFTAGNASPEEFQILDDITFNNPISGWKSLRTSVEAPSGFWGTVSATFASFKAQDGSWAEVLADEFPGPNINTTNWGPNLELVREIENGHLRLKYKRINLTANASNTLPFSHPETINEIQAKVSLSEFLKSVPETNMQARIGGYFFNTTGSPYNDQMNEVFAAIGLGGSIASPRVVWYVNRMTNADGTASEFLAPDSYGILGSSFTTPATFTLYLHWDGVRFTFTATDDSSGTPHTITYTPVTGIYPSNSKYKEIGVRIWAPANQVNDSTIEATFDEVMTDIHFLINLPLILRN
jgi:hypothetical protein